MDNYEYSNIVSFNCRSIKRSIEGVRILCQSADVVALQETWLLPHDLPLLSTIDDDFGCTGTSAVDTAAGILSGRPYGGVAVLWRKSVFEKVSVIECDNVRVCGIKATVSGKSIVICSIYMPTNSYDNIVEFTECLGVVRSIVEAEESMGVEAFYLLGDFNAHPNELFYNEMLDFCIEQDWLCIDVNMCPTTTFTYHSDIHGCDRWLDHCIVTESARDTIVKVHVQYDVFWSDHYPLIVRCNLNKLKPKVNDLKANRHVNKVIWGDRHTQQINQYHNLCCSKLRLMHFPEELATCCDGFCNKKEHNSVLDIMYSEIIDTLSEAAISTYRNKCKKRGGYITGWNKYVAGPHREARLKFKQWILAGRPPGGNCFREMSETKRLFKSKLKWCQDRQEQLRMDLLASNHSAKDFKSFWKNTNKLNARPSLPLCVGDACDHINIANAFKNHFTVKSPLGPSLGELPDGGAVMMGLNVKIPAKNVVKIISTMQRGKSPGHDGLSIEHFKYAGVHLPRVLSLFFTLCISHSYLPEELMRTIVVPIVKNKTGNTSDMGNYRPISLATTAAKVLDSLLNSCLLKHINIHDTQFGFKAGVSTESAILTLKHAVGYYTARKTPVYACFLDLSKAFDLVSYDKLWAKLRGACVPEEYITLFEYWYANQKNQIRWVDALSDEYKLECGVRQGGLSSPLLFNLYINQLIGELSSMRVGCHIDGTCVNNISYADDMVLLCPSIGGLRKLLHSCEAYVAAHGLRYNTTKSEILIFQAIKQQPRHVPPVCLAGVPLKIVTSFKYLGHIVTCDLRDNADIERERRALSVRSNMLARRFARCTANVKITLFKAFCQSFYASGLWVTYTRRAFSVLRVQYNNAFRRLLGLPWRCSASGMFAEARTDGFPAIMRKKAASLLQRLRASSDSVLKMISGRPDCPIQNHLMRMILGLV